MFNLDIVLTPVITVLTGSIVAYFMLKRLRKEAISIAFEIIETKQEEIMTASTEFLQSAEGQKLLYSLGALIGSGVMGGTGIQKKSGKFQWENLATQVIGSFLQSKTGINPLPQNNPQLDQKPNNQNKVNVRSA